MITIEKAFNNPTFWEMHIFYSWQSDLANNTNRSFIESCISSAIKELEKRKNYPLRFKLDKDTANEPGTPDIADTILRKIERSKVFVADLSIINSSSQGRKTSNPNVLLELGYAAKAIGWERVICVFNEDYGNIKELPFDLRHRRPVIYSINKTGRSDAKKHVAAMIVATVESLFIKGLLNNEIGDYIKQKVDTEILSIINHMDKLLFGYSSKPNVMVAAQKLLNLERDEIKNILKTRIFDGFQAFKTLIEQEKKFNKIIENTISSSHYRTELQLSILKLKNWTEWYQKVIESRSFPDLFVKVRSEQKPNMKVVSGKELGGKENEKLPYRYILLEKIDNSHGRVLDFGDFIETDRVNNLLNTYRMNPLYIDTYCNLIEKFIDLVNSWLDLGNGEFIIDTMKMFEMRDKSGKLL